MPKPAARDVEARAEDVLARRIELDSSALITLIREVNPTPRALPARVIERRYQLKSRLQSLLIRRDPEALAIEPGPAGAPDVLLRHRWLGIDACHARIDALDDDARAWVRLQLDLGTPEFDAETRRLGGDERSDDSPIGLVRRGRAELATYDYEEAERLLREAFARSGGAAFAATALFELLVDTLARDEDALATHEALSPTARGQPSVRAALGLGAARLGRLDEARTWLDGAAGARAAEAWILIARAMLESGDVGEAIAAIDHVRGHVPAHGELVALEEELARVRREVERPLIEARRREQEARERARREALSNALAQAAEAEACGDDETALLRLEQARMLGGEVEEALGRVRERLAARERERKIEGIVERLGVEQAEAEALAAFGELDPDARAEVRRRLEANGPAAQLLGWMEAIGIGSTTAKVRATAEAVVALADAEADLARGDAAGALARLAQHERVLSGFVEARRVEAKARSLRKVQHEADRARAEAERREAEERQSKAQRERDCEQYVRRATLEADNGVWLEAQRLGRLALRAADDDGRRTALQGQLAEWASLQAEVFLRWFAPPPESPVERSFDDVDYAIRDAAHLLVGDSEFLVCLATIGEYLFVVEREVATKRTVRRVVFNLLEPFLLADAVVRGDGILLCSCYGQLLELTWSDFGIRRLLFLPSALRRPFGDVRSLSAPPGSELLWLSDADRQSRGTFGFDPDTYAIIREDRARSLTVRSVSDGVSTRLVILDKAGGEAAELRTSSGRPLPDPCWPADGNVTAVAPRPSGEGGLVVLISPRAPGDVGPDKRLVRLAIWSNGDTVRREVECRFEDDAMPVELATSLDDELVFLLSSGKSELVAFREESGGLVEAWRTKAPSLSHLRVDQHSRRVVLVGEVDGFDVWALGAEPPSIARKEETTAFAKFAAKAFGLVWPKAHGPFLCAREVLPKPPDPATLAALLSGDADGLTPEVLLDLASFAYSFRLDEDGPKVAEALRTIIPGLLKALPENVELRESAANLAVIDDDWARVSEALEPKNGAALPADASNHYLHLLGLARLRNGDLEGARAAWTTNEAAESEKLCGLSTLVTLVDALLLPLEQHDPQNEKKIPHRLIGIVRWIDAHLASGDVEAAAELAEDPLIIALGELQSCARMAAALLRRPRTVGDPFRTALRLATYVAVFEVIAPLEPATAISYQPRCHFGPHEWPPERLAELATEARRWLEELPTAGTGG